MEMKWKSDSEKKANNLFDEDDKNLVVVVENVSW